MKIICFLFGHKFHEAERMIGRRMLVCKRCGVGRCAAC